MTSKEEMLWRRAIDKKNRTYYFHILTHESSWHPPPGYQPEDIPFGGVQGSTMVEDAAEIVKAKISTTGGSNTPSNTSGTSPDNPVGSGTVTDSGASANTGIASASTGASAGTRGATGTAGKRGRAAIKEMLLQAENDARSLETDDLAAADESGRSTGAASGAPGSFTQGEGGPAGASNEAPSKASESTNPGTLAALTRLASQGIDIGDDDAALEDALAEYEKATAAKEGNPTFERVNSSNAGQFADSEAYEENPQFSPHRVERPSGSWIPHEEDEEAPEAGDKLNQFVLQRPRRESIHGIEIDEANGGSQEDTLRNAFAAIAASTGPAGRSASRTPSASARRASLTPLDAHFAMDTVARLGHTAKKVEKPDVIPWNSRRASLAADQETIQAAARAAAAGYVGFSYPASTGFIGTRTRSASRSRTESPDSPKRLSEGDFFERERRWKEERAKRQSEMLAELEKKHAEMYTFKPAVSVTTAKLLSESAEARQRLFAARRAKKTEILALTVDSERNKECTFKPAINPESAKLASGRPSFLERTQRDIAEISEKAAQEIERRRKEYEKRRREEDSRLGTTVSPAELHPPDVRAKFQPEVVGVKRDMTAATEYVSKPVFERLASTPTNAFTAYANAAQDAIELNLMSFKNPDHARLSRRAQHERDEASESKSRRSSSLSRSRSHGRAGLPLEPSPRPYTPVRTTLVQPGAGSTQRSASVSRERRSSSVPRPQSATLPLDRQRRQSIFAPSSPAFASSSGRRGESVFYSTQDVPNPEALNPTESFAEVIERLKQRHAEIEARVKALKEKQQREAMEKRNFKLSEKSAMILDHSGLNTTTFEERLLISIHARDKRGELAEAKLKSREHERFHPEISPFSQQLPSRSIEELAYGDQLRRRQLLQEMRQQKEEEDSRELTFKPDISKSQQNLRRSGQMQSLLSVENLDEYHAMVRAKLEEKRALAEARRLERERLEAEACTFKPKINPLPEFIKEQAQVAKARRAETPKARRSSSRPAWQ